MAQPLPALAHGNLFRTEDGQDRLCGVLGIHAAGKKTATALSEVDFRDGQLRAAEAEKSIALSSQQSAISESNWQLANPLYRKGREGRNEKLAANQRETRESKQFNRRER
jgi:hypothetical protein